MVVRHVYKSGGRRSLPSYFESEFQNGYPNIRCVSCSFSHCIDNGRNTWQCSFFDQINIIIRSIYLQVTLSSAFPAVFGNDGEYVQWGSIFSPAEVPYGNLQFEPIEQ